jgi:hypothetical protein
MAERDLADRHLAAIFVSSSSEAILSKAPSLVTVEGVLTVKQSDDMSSAVGPAIILAVGSDSFAFSFPALGIQRDCKTTPGTRDVAIMGIDWRRRTTC